MSLEIRITSNGYDTRVFGNRGLNTVDKLGDFNLLELFGEIFLIFDDFHISLNIDRVKNLVFLIILLYKDVEIMLFEYICTYNTC